MKMQRASGPGYSRVKRLVNTNGLHTICSAGNCPNIGECWNSGTATFMILGDTCTRSCKFCATRTGKPLPPDETEPTRLAETIKLLELRHCVITSVDRDDLADGGASFWARTISCIRQVNPATTIEALIPDFNGDPRYIAEIIDADPDIISHNIETVRRLTPRIRSKAKYDTSMDVIKHVSRNGKRAKSGFMVGLGETREEILETISDLYNAGCRILTVGQYLKPTPHHMEAVEYLEPACFDDFRNRALSIGFDLVESSPLARSSFHSGRHVKAG
jgi:lipoic acid synthetase